MFYFSFVKIEILYVMQKYCIWDSSLKAQVNEAWVLKVSQRYSDFSKDIRDAIEKPEYLARSNTNIGKLHGINMNLDRNKKQIRKVKAMLLGHHPIREDQYLMLSIERSL